MVGVDISFRKFSQNCRLLLMRLEMRKLPVTITTMFHSKRTYGEIRSQLKDSIENCLAIESVDEILI